MDNSVQRKDVDVGSRVHDLKKSPGIEEIQQVLDRVSPVRKQEIETVGQQRKDQIVVLHSEFGKSRRDQAGHAVGRLLEIGFRVGLKHMKLAAVVGPHIKPDQRPKIELEVGLMSKATEVSQHDGVDKWIDGL